MKLQFIKMTTAILSFLFFACDQNEAEQEKIPEENEENVIEKLNFTFTKFTQNGKKEITTAQLLAQIKEKEKAGFKIKNLTVNNSEIAQVNGEKPNFSIKIKKIGTFKITLVLEKKGFADVKIEGEITIYAAFDFTYGGSSFEQAHAIVETSDGNLVVAGYTWKEATQADFWVVKIGKNDGKIIWQKTYGAGNEERCYAIIKTADDNLAVAGYKQINRNKRDLWILKLNKEDGNKIWQKTYGGNNTDSAQSIIKTKDGHLVVAGYKNNGYLSEDFWILKLNQEDGNIIWEKTHDGGGGGGFRGEKAYSIVEMADEHLAIAGFTYAKGAGASDFWVLKLNKENGNVMWEKTYGGVWYDFAKAIIETSDGHLAVAGQKGEKHGAYTHYDFYVLKINKTNGNKIWEKTYRNSNRDFLESITKTADGHLVVAGTTDVSGHAQDFWILKLNKENGNIIWQKTYGAGNEERCYAIIKTADDNLAVAGFTKSKGAGETDFWVLKLYASDGAIVGSRE